ncbi:MAG: saccharopine dehydrogenase NADP-binding domain-containing protein [Chloroflexi bacterium]|nr:saccharopine dehydrogenase NADP-binding domain-containing protein [Chloroflexota bacterium]
MKQVLVHLDTDRHPGVYLRVLAIDAGIEHVLAYGSVTADDVRDLVHGVLFSRHEAALRASAIAISGADVVTAEEMLHAADAAMLGPLRVSLLLDPRGANTTAAATVVQLAQDVGVRGRRVLVLGGTGPVGVRLAGLLANAGAEVLLASRRRDRARDAADRVRRRLGVRVEAVEVKDDRGVAKALKGVQVLVNAVAPGIQMVHRPTWANAPDLVAVVDVNAVPPPGIDGVSPADDGNQRDGRRCYGALAIGTLKAAIQRRCLTRLFERNDLVLDAEEIFDLARSVALLGANAQPPAAPSPPEPDVPDDPPATTAMTADAPVPAQIPAPASEP